MRGTVVTGMRVDGCDLIGPEAATDGRGSLSAGASLVRVSARGLPEAANPKAPRPSGGSALPGARRRARQPIRRPSVVKYPVADRIYATMHRMLSRPLSSLCAIACRADAGFQEAARRATTPCWRSAKRRDPSVHRLFLAFRPPIAGTTQGSSSMAGVSRPKARAGRAFVAGARFVARGLRGGDAGRQRPARARPGAPGSKRRSRLPAPGAGARAGAGTRARWRR